MNKVTDAVEEAGAFLAAHENLFDSREVRVISSVADPDRQLSLGAVRVLYELAVAAQGMHQKVTEAQAAYQAATGEL